MRYSILFGHVSLQSTNQGSQSHGVPAGWETFQQDNEPAEWPSFKGEPSQQPHGSSSNPFDVCIIVR